MGEPTLECYNCGRENPGWAQICRSCGVSLSGAERWTSGAPPPRFPTDSTSLISMGAALATVVAAVLVALVVANLDPNEAGAVGERRPTPAPTPRAATPSVVATATVAPAPTATPAPTPTPTPVRPGTLAFGTAFDPATKQITAPATAFAPGSVFAHSITLTEPFGVGQIQEEVVRVAEDGTETVVQRRNATRLIVDPSATIAAFSVNTNLLIESWGAGTYRMRVYRGDELLAEGEFQLTA